MTQMNAADPIKDWDPDLLFGDSFLTKQNWPELKYKTIYPLYLSDI